MQILFVLMKRWMSLVGKQGVNAQHSSEGWTGTSLELFSVWITLLGGDMPCSASGFQDDPTHRLSVTIILSLFTGFELSY